MSHRFKLPRSAAQADKLAGGLLAEATEREWSLAALVYAQVLPHGKRKDSPDRSSAIQRVTCNQFAGRGIRGLSSENTVKKYRDTWQAAVDAGHADGDIRLGQEVELPDAEWGDFYPGDPRDGTPERHVSKEQAAITPEKVRAAVKADPLVAAAAEDALAEKLVEYAENAALEAIQRGGKVTACEPKVKAEGGLWDVVAEEVRRAEPIHELRRLVEEARVQVDQILANGDPVNREAEYLAPVVKEIGEIYWSLSKLVVESEEAGR